MLEKNSVILKILEVARWAPSGDNSQPWRFTILSDERFIIHPAPDDQSVPDIYNGDGRAKWFSIGALVENISISASAHGYKAQIIPRKDSPEHFGWSPYIEIILRTDHDIRPDELYPFIEERSVQRGCMKRRLLTSTEKAELERSVPSGVNIEWVEKGSRRWGLLKLISHFTDIRLRLPETYKVHLAVIEFFSRYSRNKMPDQSLGLSRLTLLLTRWVLKSWERTDFMNRFMGGTIIPRIEMDLIPGIFCAGYFVLYSKALSLDFEGDIGRGRALQRFWLQATRLGLQIQPQYPPVIFSHYARNNISFTSATHMIKKLSSFSKKYDDFFGGESSSRDIYFIGRIGEKKNDVSSRSLRLDLESLINQ
ncbi:MAG: nitroreductase family protein [Alphaproteobacteria bacterium]|nr:nitroreductase family protein [Alphaproteobacteria bacterium]